MRFSVSDQERVGEEQEPKIAWWVIVGAFLPLIFAVWSDSPLLHPNQVEDTFASLTWTNLKAPWATLAYFFSGCFAWLPVGSIELRVSLGFTLPHCVALFVWLRCLQFRTESVCRSPWVPLWGLSIAFFWSVVLIAMDWSLVILLLAYALSILASTSQKRSLQLFAIFSWTGAFVLTPINGAVLLFLYLGRWVFTLQAPPFRMSVLGHVRKTASRLWGPLGASILFWLIFVCVSLFLRDVHSPFAWGERTWFRHSTAHMPHWYFTLGWGTGCLFFVVRLIKVYFGSARSELHPPLVSLLLMVVLSFFRENVLSVLLSFVVLAHAFFALIQEHLVFGAHLQLLAKSKSKQLMQSVWALGLFVCLGFSVRISEEWFLPKEQKRDIEIASIAYQLVSRAPLRTNAIIVTESVDVARWMQYAASVWSLRPDVALLPVGSLLARHEYQITHHAMKQSHDVAQLVRAYTVKRELSEADVSPLARHHPLLLDLEATQLKGLAHHVAPHGFASQISFERLTSSERKTVKAQLDARTRFFINSLVFVPESTVLRKEARRTHLNESLLLSLASDREAALVALSKAAALGLSASQVSMIGARIAAKQPIVGDLPVDRTAAKRRVQSGRPFGHP